MGNLGRIIGDGGHARVVQAECGDVRVIAIGNNKIRRKIDLEQMRNEDWSLSAVARVPDPQSLVGERSLCYVFCEHGPGCQFLAGSIVAVGAKLGRHVIVNHNAVVDHDCVIGDYVHIAPGATISGGAKIGEGALIGPGANVGIGAVVPPWAIVRANSVFPHDYYVHTPRKAGSRRLRTLQYDHPVDWRVHNDDENG